MTICTDAPTSHNSVISRPHARHNHTDWIIMTRDHWNSRNPNHTMVTPNPGFGRGPNLEVSRPQYGWIFDPKQYPEFEVAHKVNTMGTKLMKNRQPRTYVGTLHIQFIPINLGLNVKVEAIKCTLLKGHFWQGNCRSSGRNPCNFQ